jgi:Holliday junction resolvase-like predicted endonuclease
MSKSILWQITPKGPQRIRDGELKLEEHLEDWLETSPELLQPGFTIIGRQLAVAAGRVDLLALDPAGRLAIIEIKRGTLYRETVAQGLDYVDCIMSLQKEALIEMCDQYLRKRKRSFLPLLQERDALSQLEKERREVLLFVVGTGKAERLERMARLLQKSIQIYIVTFDVLALAGGQQILIRDLTEADMPQPAQRPAPATVSLEKLFRQADAAATGKDFRRLAGVGLRLGLYPRLYKGSVMFAPQESRNRMIFTVWTKPVNGKLQAYVSPEAIAEFFPVSETKARDFIGNNGWRQLDAEDTTTLAQNLEKMFSSFKSQEI